MKTPKTGGGRDAEQGTGQMTEAISVCYASSTTADGGDHRRTGQVMGVFRVEGRGASVQEVPQGTALGRGARPCWRE